MGIPTVGTNLFTFLPGSTHTQIGSTNSLGQAIIVLCDTVPETQANTYGLGCFLIRTDNGTIYSMTGTVASPSWTVNSPGAGATGTTGTTGVTGPTGPTGP